MRKPLLLLVFPALAHAATAYDFTVRPLAQSPSTPIVNRYVDEDGKVRLDAQNGKEVLIFKDKTMYFLDTSARTVQVSEHMSLDEMNANLASGAQRMRESTANLPPEKRANSSQVDAAMAALSALRMQPQPSDYVVSGRSESVDGHTCLIWERSDKGVKRREICVAPKDEVPGSADILAGMKTMSELYGGGMFALGVSFGLSPWWSSIQSLGGVPLLLRDFSEDGTMPVYEVTLTGIHVVPRNPSLFEVPDGYEKKSNRPVPAHPAPGH